MTDMDSLNYFISVFAQCSSSCLFPSYTIYAKELLEYSHTEKCNPCRTHVGTDSKLVLDGDPASHPTLYRNLVDALQFLTFTRPGFSYVVKQVYLYMHDPRARHFFALKLIHLYVQGTIDYGLQLHVSTTTQ